MENSKLISVLDDYGADIVGIKSRFMGDVALYEKCFASILTEHNFDLLKSAISTRDYSSAFECAHAMKGLSGNLGLTPLYSAICILVESLRAKKYDNITDEYDEVNRQLARLVSLTASL